MTSILDNHLESTVSALEESIRHHARYSLGKEWNELTPKELFNALSLAVRDRLVDNMLDTEKRYKSAKAKQIYYLSMEFLIGRSLENNLSNLGLMEICEQVFSSLGLNLKDVIEEEYDAALGNGGLGRLAACFLDSLASLGYPGYGYGINYEYGLFKQEINQGYQEEKPDHWKAFGTPWQIERTDEVCMIPVYGQVVNTQDREGNYNPMWLDWKIIMGVPCDMPVVGFGGKTVNYLRLFSARSSEEFDIKIFNKGDYLKAVEQKVTSERISKVLYPSDSIDVGRELRLIQEYFLVACSLQDIVRNYLKTYDTFDEFPNKVALQLNDTHPALAVAELMRILVDEHQLPWEIAWEITQSSLAYTNHTLLPEALETWPVFLLRKVIPRHLEIIYEINRRFLKVATSIWPGDREKIKKVSIISDTSDRFVRMANLAIVGSHSVNGVSELHSELITTSLVPEFFQIWPKKFNNKTNGVTQRRWLLQSNPKLAHLITNVIGDGWITELEQLKGLESVYQDSEFQKNFMEIKRDNKIKLANTIKKTNLITVDPDSIFDVQIKRIHEYKRQLLNVLHIIHQYLMIVEDDTPPPVPKTYIFAGKAAPGYWVAKQFIKLINSVAKVINYDPRVNQYLKVAFIPDYRVTLAEEIIPAADLSEQISTAGREASGTGNMKFAMNGAITIGTLDGANIEIREEVGEDNIFIFGLTAEEIEEMSSFHSYDSTEYYYNEPYIKRVMDTLNSDLFCEDEPGLFTWIFRSLLEQGDEYFLLADLMSYIKAQQTASEVYQNTQLWSEKAILNVARIGKFSSDRTIREYAKDIWNIEPIL